MTGWLASVRRVARRADAQTETHRADGAHAMPMARALRMRNGRR